MGWAFLPPIQRTLDTPIAPVTRPAAFPAELPVWRSPAFTSALSHAVVDAVPGGVVDGDGGGLGEPSHDVGRAPELTLLPPPRPAAALQRSVATPSPAEQRPLDPPAPSAEAEEHPEPGEPDVVRPEVEAPVLTRAPSVGMPVVHRSAVAVPEPPEPPEPAAPTDIVPEAVSDRPALGSPAAGPEPPPPAASPGGLGRPAIVQRSVATPVVSPRMGLGPPIAQAPRTAVPTPPAPVESGEVPAESGEMAVESGEISIEPAGLDRENAGLTGDHARFDGDFPRFAEKAGEQGFTEVPIQRSLASDAPPLPQPSPASEPPAAKLQQPAERPSPELALARSVDVAAAPAPPSRADPAAPAPAEELADVSAPGDVVRSNQPAEAPAGDADVEPPPARLPSTPLPLAAGIATSIQRADLLPGPGSPTSSLVVRPAPLVPSRPTRERVVPIQRLAVESALVTTDPTPSRHKVSRTDSTRTPAPGPTPVQRSTVPKALATSTAPGAEATGDLLDVHAPDVGHPAEVTSSLPGPVVSRSVALAPALLAGPARAETSPAIVSRSAPAPIPPTMPLAAPPAAPPTPIAVQAAADDEPVAATGAEPGTGPPTSDGTSTSEVSPGAVTVQAAAAPAAATPAPAASASAPGKPGGSATGDVDALAQKLFPAVLRRMKAELLLDRERRGVRTDPW